MRKVWFILICSSLIVLCLKNPEECISAMMRAGQNALQLGLKLCGIYAIWLGFLGIVDKSKLSEKIASLLSPVVDFLFGKNLNQETKKFLAMNLSTNILGIGNASTPLGIKAMQGLDKQNNSEIASTAMIMLLVVSATSLQLLPTTIVGLRASLGSTSSSDIILPSIITTVLTTLLGITLVKVISKLKMQKFSLKKCEKVVKK